MNAQGNVTETLCRAVRCAAAASMICSVTSSAGAQPPPPATPQQPVPPSSASYPPPGQPAQPPQPATQPPAPGQPAMQPQPGTAPPTAPPPGAPPAAAPAPAPGYAPPPPGAYAPPPGGGYAPPPPEGPRYLPYEVGQPVPPGYYVQESVRRGPVIAGAIVLGVPYVIGVSVASGNNFEDATGWLVIPAIGPWIALGTRKNDCGDSALDCTNDAAERTLLTLDGLMQTTGAVLFIWGLASTSRRLVRNDIVELTITPTLVGSGYGVGAVGMF